VEQAFILKTSMCFMGRFTCFTLLPAHILWEPLYGDLCQGIFYASARDRLTVKNSLNRSKQLLCSSTLEHHFRSVSRIFEMAPPELE
jgi:hypothetical protein